VTEVRHWSDSLFSFRTSRPAALRFANGQFVMVGLQIGDRRIVRAYSIASANHDEWLEFYSIKVPGGPLTSRLQHLQPGDPVLISAKPTGTLVIDDLRPGQRLLLLATGTGVAPFTGIIRDPEVYTRFGKVILVRGGRCAADLDYANTRVALVRTDPILGDISRGKLIDYAAVTRERYIHTGRITRLVETGRLFDDLGVGPLDAATDRVMVCGSMRMIADFRRLLDDRGFALSPSIGIAADYVIERAFVDTTVEVSPDELGKSDGESRPPAGLQASAGP
jgi:ferredoxin--NADP+ reductase